MKRYMEFSMRYYILHKGNKIYFDFSLEGYMNACRYVELHNLGKRKLYTEKTEVNVL